MLWESLWPPTSENWSLPKSLGGLAILKTFFGITHVSRVSSLLTARFVAWCLIRKPWKRSARKIVQYEEPFKESKWKWDKNFKWLYLPIYKVLIKDSSWWLKKSRICVLVTKVWGMELHFIKEKGSRSDLQVAVSEWTKWWMNKVKKSFVESGPSNQYKFS